MGGDNPDEHDRLAALWGSIVDLHDTRTNGKRSNPFIPNWLGILIYFSKLKPAVLLPVWMHSRMDSMFSPCTFGTV